MGIRRKKALDGIEDLVSQVQNHLEKLANDATNPAADHWRAELRAFLGRMRKLAQHLGRKTGEMWLARIEQWEVRTEDVG